MNIAVINRTLEAEFRQHGREGGTGYQLAVAVRDLGHEVVALTQAPDAKTASLTRLGGLPCWVFSDERRAPLSLVLDKALKPVYGYRKILTDARMIRRFVSEEGPFDVVWAMSEDPDGLGCGFAHRLGLTVPYVVQVQALRYDLRKPLPRFTHQRALGLGFRHAVRVVANSPMVRQDLNRHYGVEERKLSWLPHNLTRQFLLAAQTPGEPQSGAPPGVLFLGALNSKKGADVFLRAAREVAQRRSDVGFKMIGNLTDKNSVFARGWPSLLREAGLGARLQLLGHLSSAEVVREIRSASLVAMPSRMDEFSRATIECLALGAPVIVTERMGAAYLPARDGSGLVIPPGNAPALAGKMVELMENPAFGLAARSHREQIQAEFSPTRLASEWVKIFGEILKR